MVKKRQSVSLYDRAKKIFYELVWKRSEKNILHIYTFHKLKKNKEYNKLSSANRKDCNRKILILDTPRHENIGDQAIALAEIDFITPLIGEKNLCEFTKSECITNLGDIEKATMSDDYIAIHGGGFIGTLWPEEEETFIKIIQQFKNNKIIVFPQTIYFDKTESAKYEIEKFCKAVRECKNINFFVRDKKSYQWLDALHIMPKGKYHLVPDIVTSYKKEDFSQTKREKIVWLCFRNDCEKQFDNLIIEELKKQLCTQGYQVLTTDTIYGEAVEVQKRVQVVHGKIKQFARGRLVITDRLHGMILSALSETPCIALDNKSKKVSGGYEWLKHLDYIKCIKDDELTWKLVLEMLEKQNCVYQNDILEPYYDLIRKELR